MGDTPRKVKKRTVIQRLQEVLAAARVRLEAARTLVETALAEWEPTERERLSGMPLADQLLADALKRRRAQLAQELGLNQAQGEVSKISHRVDGLIAAAERKRKRSDQGSTAIRPSFRRTVRVVHRA